MSVKRIYVEKKAPYAVEAKQLLWEIRHILQIKTVTGLRLLNRYDVEGVDDALYQKCLPVVFSEPQVDVTFPQLPHGTKAVFAVEYLPGQYDQRAASCEECIQLVGQCARPTVRSARVYLLDGDFTADELARMKKHVINPVEAREADLSEKTTLQQQYDTPDHVETLTGFTAMNADEVDAFVKKYGLAMDDDDLAFCRDYFASEHRDPTLTEIRMIDTYWSDHCRHTTFLTTLDAVDVRKAAVEKAFQRYLAARKTVYGDRERPMNLMDIATIGTKTLKKRGLLPELDESEEINACSIHVTATVDGVKLSCLQFLFAGVISTVCMFLFEDVDFAAIWSCILPLLYVGIFSCGVGYTLQILAQKGSNPTVVTILLSLESVFAVIAGAIILKQQMSVREYIGCAVMFAAVLLAQIDFPVKQKAE